MLTAPRSNLPWALMAMEGTVAYAVLLSWLGGPLPALATLTLLVLGFLGVRSTRIADLSTPYRLAVGGAIALLGSLLMQVPSDSSFLIQQLWSWVLSSLGPASLGVLVWWRGVSLGETEFSPAGVWNEFALVGLVLFALIALFGVPPDPLLRIVLVLLYLTTGLAAVALARQEAAGSTVTAASIALVAGPILVVLAAGGMLVLLLRPGLISAALSLLAEALLIIVRLLLIPLTWLFSGFDPQLPPLERQSPAAPADPAAIAEGWNLPEWIQHIMAIGLLSVTILVAILLALVLFLVVSMLVQRLQFRSESRAPAAIEQDGGALQDLAALAVAMRRWLQGLTTGPRPVVGTSELRLVHDTRAAYRAFLLWARRKGVKRQPAETPREFERRLAQELPSGASSYRLLTERYEWARYGGLSLTDGDLQLLRSALEALQQPEPEGG